MNYKIKTAAFEEFLNTSGKYLTTPGKYKGACRKELLFVMGAINDCYTDYLMPGFKALCMTKKNNAAGISEQIAARFDIAEYKRLGLFALEPVQEPVMDATVIRDIIGYLTDIVTSVMSAKGVTDEIRDEYKRIGNATYPTVEDFLINIFGINPKTGKPISE